MRPIRTFAVVPTLPPALEPLRTLAYNLRWSWDHDTQALFRRLDPELCQEVGNNPVLMLGRLAQSQLDAAASDDDFLNHLNRVWRDFQDYQGSRSTWFDREYGESHEPQFAYFSAEFGLAKCLTIFAGGLGILAGDHLKSASDLGIPLVGVGLLYQQGYFHQYLSEAGWQQEAYIDNDFHNLPLTLERHSDGRPMRIEIPMGGRQIGAWIWRVDVGRVHLYLLDTNLPENEPDDRNITDQLYGGDVETRIRQEIVLGIGGCRALVALGLNPCVYHMNEGHSAFLGLERIRRIIAERGVSFAEAREVASAGSVFTTHTPVPAGQDFFPPYLMDRYFGDYYPSLHLNRSEFLALGRQNPNDDGEPFNMTVLALRLASFSNGVSELHGHVSRRMWQSIWPGVPESEVPIGHVTNGAHLRTWISEDIDQLYDRFLGESWRDAAQSGENWRRVYRIPDEDLWSIHEQQRERLIAYSRRKVRQQAARHAASQTELDRLSDVLDSNALTIGFARRFATYKRATLLLQDPERLARLLSNPERPVQIIFSGKAHPRDDLGKELIRQIVTLAREEPFRGRIVFLEDYDMETSAHLVQGADVWLNNPRRPMEASGTSGMKAAANGGLNVSTLDGWWAEAWESIDPAVEPIGWPIGRGEDYANPADQDRVEANALYDLLEYEVIPAFYERGPNGLPLRWIERMKASIARVSPFFNTNRMVWEYTDRFYVPAARRFECLTAHELAGARDLASWRARVYECWSQVRVAAAHSDASEELAAGSPFEVRALVELGSLRPHDVRVEVYYGPIGANGQIVEAQRMPMECIASEGEGNYQYEAQAVPGSRSGLHGFTVRVLPYHPELVTPFVPGLITWA